MNMRDFINLVEAEINRTDDKAEVELTGTDSMVYTKLAQKVERISQLEEEIKQLKAQVKSETRQYVAGLFEADDEVRTRVVNTKQFVLTLSKQPKPTETYQYAKIVAELEKSLTPKLLVVLQNLKEQFKTVVQKEPSLRIEPRESVTESILSNLKGYFRNYLSFIVNWGKHYDRELAILESML